MPRKMPCDCDLLGRIVGFETRVEDGKGIPRGHQQGILLHGAKRNFYLNKLKSVLYTSNGQKQNSPKTKQK